MDQYPKKRLHFFSTRGNFALNLMEDQEGDVMILGKIGVRI
jgi:hypothetical protein